MAAGHGRPLRQGCARRGAEGDGGALPVRRGLPRRALLRLLRRGAGRAVLPAVLPAHRRELPYGHRRAHRVRRLRAGLLGTARPLCALPLQAGEPRALPVAADTARHLLRHPVPAEVPHLLLAAHHAGAGVLGVGAVLLDARPRVGGALCRAGEMVFGGVAVHGARGGVPPAARRAVAFGLPAVLARLHHGAAPVLAARRARVRLPRGTLRGGGGRPHGATTTRASARSPTSGRTTTSR